jgi:Glycosyltransferase family 87
MGSSQVHRADGGMPPGHDLALDPSATQVGVRSDLLGRWWSVRLALVLLAVAACVNVAAGVVLALRDPRRASDLWTMYDWCRAWLAGGRSLYAAADASTDYPPNAIVLLSPLALVPPRWVVPLWTAGAVALTPVLPWLVVRCASPGDRRPLARPLALIAPALLYLCWAAPRTLLQFSLLSMTLGCAALYVADAHRFAAGVALGLALFKPHMAGPIALWMLLTSRFRPLITAVAVVVGGAAVYDARIGESPVTTAAGWWKVIGSVYAGSDGLVGHTSIRAWTQMAAHDPVIGDALWIAASVLLLAALCGIAMRDRSRALEAGGLAVPAMFCLWSLLATYHNGNNMILMLPAFAFLWFRDDRYAWAPRWIPILALQAALMFDVPVRLNDMASSHGWGRIVIEQFDRLVVLATLAWVSIVWCRLTAAR